LHIIIERAAGKGDIYNMLKLLSILKSNIIGRDIGLVLRVNESFN